MLLPNGLTVPPKNAATLVLPDVVQLLHCGAGVNGSAIRPDCVPLNMIEASCVLAAEMVAGEMKA